MQTSLTTRNPGRKFHPATAKSVAGFSSPVSSGESRVEFIPRLFSCLALPCSMGGRAGEPKGSPVLDRSANPVRSPTLFSSRRGRFNNRNRAHTMATHRTQAATAAAPARTVPGYFLTDLSLYRVQRCACMVDMLAGVAMADIEAGRVLPQSITAVAEAIADDLRTVARLASPTTGPEPYAETDAGTAQDATEAALLALWRSANRNRRHAIAKAAGAPQIAGGAL